jgi:hypothetical protein
MTLICDVDACDENGAFTVKGFSLCTSHADEVIDKLREAGLTVRLATREHAENLIAGIARRATAHSAAGSARPASSGASAASRFHESLVAEVYGSRTHQGTPKRPLRRF